MKLRPITSHPKEHRHAHDRRLRHGRDLRRPHQLATDLAAAVMAIEQVPDIPMFRQNTAAFIHDLPAGNLSNVDGDPTTCGSRSSTNWRARSRQAAGHGRAADPHRRRGRRRPDLARRTWVLLTEAPDGGWGLDGHANTNQELVAAARAQIANLQAGQPQPNSKATRTADQLGLSATSEETVR